VSTEAKLCHDTTGTVRAIAQANAAISRGYGDDPLVHVLTSGAQQPISLAQPQLGLPGDGADLGGHAFQAELQMAAHLRRIPIGPRPFDQRPPDMAVPGLGDPTLVPALSRRGLRRREAEGAHPLPRGVEPCEVAHFSNERDGAGPVETAERLNRLHHREQPPRLDRRVQLRLQAPEPFALLRHGVHVLLEDDLLRRRRAPYPGQPAEVRRVPVRTPS
jgi:hypothetical protein